MRIWCFGKFLCSPYPGYSVAIESGTNCASVVALLLGYMYCINYMESQFNVYGNSP